MKRNAQMIIYIEINTKKEKKTYFYPYGCANKQHFHILQVNSLEKNTKKNITNQNSLTNIHVHVLHMYISSIPLPTQIFAIIKIALLTKRKRGRIKTKP